MDDEIEIKSNIAIILLMIIIAFIFGYVYHKFTNDDTKLVKEFKGNFLKCSAECNSDGKVGFITQLDETHYRCICNYLSK